MGPLLVIMGVSACGKSTVGRELSLSLDAQFFEGDDFHPAANIEKMSGGTPLTDADRAAWLDAILSAVNSSKAPNLTLACSALTPYVQERLISGAEREVIWIWLSAPQNIIAERLKHRGGHFMPPELLKSQFAALSPSKAAIEIDVSQPPAFVIANIIERLSALPSYQKKGR